MVDAFNRRDAGDWVSRWDADCEFVTLTGSHIDGEPYRRHAGLQRYADERDEVWQSFRSRSRSCARWATRPTRTPKTRSPLPRRRSSRR
jgi:hypothetical protein